MVNMEWLEKYAELLVRIGINVQKGQTIVLAVPVESADFAHLLQKRAYAAGAREVVLRWIDEVAARITYDLADDAIFDEFPEWSKQFFNGYADKGAGFLSIVASDPEIMKGIDPKKISRSMKVRSKALEYFRMRQMSNKNTWCVASIPSAAWARKVFPGLSDEKAIEKLWEAIFKSVRIDQADPVQAWRDHQRALTQRMDFLHASAFTALRYRSGLGTDLTIRLPENYIWAGGGETCPEGYVFIANMPTEEVFTLPHREGANGKIVSSLPLNHNGSLIEDFWFSFKDGLVVDYGAARGLDTLKEMLETDEGSRRLGEVALVPYDSPISNQRILFYNTLFDENASCHFALGKAYPSCVKGGDEMSPEQLLAAGVNDSLIHVDFMIGTADLSITGIKADGSEVPVFIKGNFAPGIDG
ncbi:MAG: aminopeptidase [Spirochaetes bacterium]|nr:aminopeptidase [Spirochaetota bacterium]MBU0954785.1 aminopeptidase [Spirochaetota bacterium]